MSVKIDINSMKERYLIGAPKRAGMVGAGEIRSGSMVPEILALSLQQVRCMQLVPVKRPECKKAFD